MSARLRRRQRPLLVALVAVVAGASGCGNDAAAARSQQSGSIAVAPDGLLYVADAENGGVAVVNPAPPAGRVAFINTGARPERVIVRGNFVYVSNRQSRSVTQIDATTRQIVQTFAVGAEPLGIDTTDDGSTLVVANAMSGSVQAINTTDGSTRWTTPLNDEVHAVSVLPDGRIYAPSYRLGVMHVLEVGSGHEVLPAFSLVQPAETTAGGRQPTAVESALLDETGGRVYIPGTGSLNGALTPSMAGYYASPAPAAADNLPPVVPALTTVQYKGNQVRLPSDPTQDFPPPFTTPVSGTPIAGPRAVALEIDGRYLYVVNQLSNNISIVTSDPTNGDIASLHGLVATVAVGQGPTGIVLTPGDSTGYVYNAFDHSISVLGVRSGQVQVVRQIPSVTSETLTAAQQNGRTLFYAADDARLSLQASGGLACASCHPDGRADRHVWQLPEGARNTPSLAGRHLELTAPYDWDGQLVGAQSFSDVVQNRMGGTGLAPSDYDDIFTWLESEPSPDNPTRAVDGSLDADQTAGRVLFLLTAGCAACHSGATFTDNGFWDVGTSFSSIGIGLSGAAAGLQPWKPNTPSLLSLFASPPYFHDGSASTLEELVGMNPGGGMHGNTQGLTATQQAQLVAYLMTL